MPSTTKDMEMELAAEKHSADELRRALIEANELLRSTYWVANRCGEETNWGPFQDELAKHLRDTHGVVNRARAALGDS